jgi:CheY-like chemotaxis protein
MKCALLLERDAGARRDLCGLLRSLGYLVASVDTPATALNTVHALRCDLILTDTTFNMDDRRAFLGELERLAPAAPIVLLSDVDGKELPGHAERERPLLGKPVTLRALRRVIEFGIDGYGMLPSASPGRGRERRRHAPRRSHGR